MYKKFKSKYKCQIIKKHWQGFLILIYLNHNKKLHFEKKSSSWCLLRESRLVKWDQRWYYEDGLFVLVVE